MLLEEGKRYVLMNGHVTSQVSSKGSSSGKFRGWVLIDGEWDSLQWDGDGTVYGNLSNWDVSHEYVEEHVAESPIVTPSAVTIDVDRKYQTLSGYPVKILSRRGDGCFVGLIECGGDLGVSYTEVFQPDGTVIKAPGLRITHEITETVTKEVPPSPEPLIRTFETGATRNLDTNKLDYDGFFCPMSMHRFAEYMHSHRRQKDGKMRDADNWQKGIGFDVYIKSMFRHFMDLRLLHKGKVALSPEDQHEITIDEALCAIMFNVQGYLHEYLKAKEKESSDV
jgi:hypothetical protein